MKPTKKTNNPTRRTFLKTTGAATVYGTAALKMGFANPLFSMAKDTLKVGLIGCGGRGTGAAVQALSADPDTELFAMADIFEDRLNGALGILEKTHGKRVNVAKDRRFLGFDAFQKLIDSDVDVVLLACPPGFRPKHFAAAVAASKHIFYEKPVAVDAPGVRMVLEAAKKAKKKNLSLVSGYCFRYDLPKQELYGKVLAGAIGEIKSISATRNGGELWYKDRQPDWNAMQHQMRNWYYHNWLSGDFIVEMFVHSLDMMAWALGEKMPLRATGTGGRQWRTDEKYGNIYDHFAVEYDYDNGIKGYAFTRQQNGGSSRNAVDIMGTEGNALFEGSRHEISGNKPWRYRGEGNDMYQAEHDALFKSIREGKGINDGERSAKSTLFGIMSRMAAYSGQTVTWEEAMNSTMTLGPDNFNWDLEFEGPKIAVPGTTNVLR